ncbi:MAG: ankyrin repeat domain-containing protein [Armatimonas sp.]
MTEVDKDLWKAVLTNDALGVHSAVDKGADIERRIGEIRLNTAISIWRVFSEKPSPSTPEEETKNKDFLVRNLDRPFEARLEDFPEEVRTRFKAMESRLEDFREETYTPLLVALHYGFFEAAKALIAVGADPNSATDAGLTPLLIAVRKGEVELAQQLLAAGAEPNKAMAAVPPGARGHSPLVRAAGDGNLAMVKLLLEHGADINKRDGAGRTALLAACLRPEGAIFWADNDEKRGLESATETAWPANLSVEAREELLKARDATGEWDSVITLLLERGADVEAETPGTGPNETLLFKGAGTPLLAAAQRGDAPLVKKLLAAGALPRSVCGTSPLQLALQSGKNQETIRLLLDAGASLIDRDSEGISPLENAVRVGYLEGIQRLVDAGADLAVRSPEHGATLLHSAAQSGHAEIVQYLLDADLEIDAICTISSPAERRARWDKRHLQENGQAVNNRIAVSLLIPPGEPSTERPAGVTPLMLAAKANTAPVVALLLARGANPRLRDSTGKSARDYALSTADAENRQRAFITARPDPLQNPDIQATFQIIHEDSFREEMTQKLEAMHKNFGAMMERMMDAKRTAREETLALLPE